MAILLARIVEQKMALHPRIKPCPLAVLAILSLGSLIGCGAGSSSGGGSPLASSNLTFGANIQISPLGSSVDRSVAVGDHSIAILDGSVYIVWADNKTGDYDIYLAVGSDRGRIFDPPLIVNDVTPREQRSPEVAVDLKGNLYIVWEDNRDGDAASDFDLYFTKGTKQPDGGIRFSKDILVNDDADQSNAPRDHSNPALAVDADGNVYIAWEDPRNLGPETDIFFAKGTPGSDGMITFSKSQRVNQNLAGISDYGDPSIAVDARGGICVGWVVFNAHSQIYMAKGIEHNGEISFQEEVKVSDDESRIPLFPSVAVDGQNNIYVVWEDLRGAKQDADIYLAKSMDGGQSFDPNINVSDAPGDQFSPSLSVDSGGRVTIAWEDHRNGDADPDIYLARSTNSGDRFGVPSRVDDDTGTAAQSSPSLALDLMGHAFLIWFDERNACVNSSCPNALYFTVGQ